MKGLVEKVYKIHTGLKNAGKDIGNWGSYKTIAPDAETAILKVKIKFQKGEYVERVELITRMD